MISEQKPFPEIVDLLEDAQSVYVVGCGTCAALCQTGGKPEVLKMRDDLQAAGKEVPGWMVIPTACDELAEQALLENAGPIRQADCLLVMACGLGVQNVVRYADRQVHPALNTLFFGKRDVEERFVELCTQCGDCVLGRTAGICPRTACAKELVNGPCGGYREGKCEVDRNRDCAWMQIYDRLQRLDRLDRFAALPPFKDYHKAAHPRRVTIVVP
ncbi:MAG: methylenetetrahydrofolate reductase C-terminal domain-containing protein [Chloroflexota bacterium]